MYDLIIKGGNVIDGCSAAGRICDIGIKDGKILHIGNGLCGAVNMINAQGLTVTPGFIDSHSHADKKILEFPDQRQKLEQGITTSVSGQCGGSAAPVKEHEVCSTMGSFLKHLKNIKLGANFACFIGHGSVRKIVLGNDNRLPNDDELERMKVYLRDAFENGAAGLSFGLFYAPGCYADKEEAIALAKVAKAYNRPISAHIRSESDQLLEATEEFIDIVRKSGCRGILSHHKAVQRRNWGKVNKTLLMLSEAVKEGLDIYCDVYPYCASSTTFSQAFIPFEWRSGGFDKMLLRINNSDLNAKNKAAFYEKNGNDFSWILITSCAAHPEFEGLTLDVIAAELELDPYDAALKLIVDSEDRCSACFFSVNEDDLMKVMSWERTMICTDGGLSGTTVKFHPRLVGSFPRAICRYTRQIPVISLVEMVRKMTSLPAFVYGLEGKGLLKEGYDADICIFDADKLSDKADFFNCNLRAEGLNYVIVDGKITVKDGVFNGEMAGKTVLL